MSLLFRSAILSIAAAFLLFFSSVAAAPEDSTVVKLTLYDAATQTPIAAFDPLSEGAVINLATLPTQSFNIHAITNPSSVGSVIFERDDSYTQTENFAPYAMMGDSGSWTPATGAHWVRATPYAESGGGGTAGTPLLVNFTVIDDPGPVLEVDAGMPRLVSLPGSSTDLTGTVTPPDGEAISSMLWEQMDGPEPATLAGANTETLNLSGLVEGLYRFRLSATATGGTSAEDITEVIVYDSSSAAVSGTLTKWHPITIQFEGPLASETDDSPNPFLDFRLQVLLIGPSGQRYDVPGFFAGDGAGGATGTVWQVRFAPDEGGAWAYAVSFRSGPDVAVQLDPLAGSPAAFDGETGSFTVAPLDSSAPGLLKWGRLEYADAHYLKFIDGPYWIKGGSNSPENFLGYAGFDNTVSQSGGRNPGAGLGPRASVGDGSVPVPDPISYATDFEDQLHRFPAHIQHWNPGEPDWVAAETGYHGKAIIGALNYLSEQHVNSLYMLIMNLAGNGGRDTYPFVSADNTDFAKTHYDVSKLYQWDLVFDHAQRRGINLQLVLSETYDFGNALWLDNGGLGVQRKLFFRELIARYSYVLGLKWNLAEETRFNTAELLSFADYIQALDWANHPITTHNLKNRDDELYDPLLGQPQFSTTGMRYENVDASALVEKWRDKSAAAGRPWVVDMDEQDSYIIGLTDDNTDDQRKTWLYDIYFSGGNIEWYMGTNVLPLGGDHSLEDFRTREVMWQQTWYARNLMMTEMPFWEMVADDTLLSGESSSYGGGQVFYKPNDVYAIYLPNASSGGILNMLGAAGTFDLRWFNPRTGAFAGAVLSVQAGSAVSLGTPPADHGEDWVVLLQSAGTPTALEFDGAFTSSETGAGTVLWLVAILAAAWLATASVIRRRDAGETPEM